MSVPGADEHVLRAHGLRVPDGYRLVSLADDPDLRRPMGEFNSTPWASFLLQGGDATIQRHWHRLFEEWPEFQHCLLDAGGRLVAASNSAPLAWDGTDEGLPEGWDDQVERSAADRDAGREADTLGAIQVVTSGEVRGSGLSGTMVEVVRENARAHGYRALIACVRPTLKTRYPLTSIERYAAWTREDGLPFDPWIRLHARLGGRIVRASPRSMTYRGSVADWEEWTALRLPDSGEYVLEGGTSPLWIDREANEGVYYDENVWMVHAV
jgi:GNAT superfamily N-acetyltransferase